MDKEICYARVRIFYLYCAATSVAINTWILSVLKSAITRRCESRLRPSWQSATFIFAGLNFFYVINMIATLK